MVNFYGGIDDFPDRIREIVEIIGNPSSAAKKAGVTASSMNRWLKGEADPSRTNLIRLADAAGVNITWLATGEGNKFNSADAVEPQADTNTAAIVLDTLGNPVDLDDFVFIPRYEVYAAAGNGQAVDDENPRFPMAFRAYWIKNYLGADPADLSVITVKGDSMTGMLENKDVILINHTQTSPRDGIYVVRINDELIVKRLQMLPRGIVRVISRNEEYQPFEINLDDEHTGVQIIGKVVWLGRTL